MVSVVQDTYTRRTGPAGADLEIGPSPAEMRWRAVHLLGSLRQADAIPVLFEIAKRPLPRPQTNEKAFADEFRVQLRCVAGLENLRAVDELKQLFESGGLLRNPAAASLYVLGVNVGNIRRVPARRALAEDVADSKDHNPGKRLPPDWGRPGRGRTNPNRRPDTPSVVNQRRGD